MATKTVLALALLAIIALSCCVDIAEGFKKKIRGPIGKFKGGRRRNLLTVHTSEGNMMEGVRGLLMESSYCCYFYKGKYYKTWNDKWGKKVTKSCSSKDDYFKKGAC